MAAPFSWSDTINIAFGSCLPCLKSSSSSGDDQHEAQNSHNPAINRIPRARADELQGLLADPDTDIEAETLSLHSNPGRGRRTKKKRRPKGKNVSDGAPRRITLFGYNLFGRPAPPPIQLPTDDNDDDALYGPSRRSRSGSESASGSGSGLTANRGLTTAHSTASTFDSDAAPLDADAIAAMSSPTAIANAAAQAADAEAQRLREKEERRQRRREKKELRRLAESLAAQKFDEDSFEGFQGSGSGELAPASSRSNYPRIPNAMFPHGPTSDSGSGSGFSGSADGAFGRFVEAPTPHTPSQAKDDDDDDAADLDGGMYARRTPRGAGGSQGSDSRSRTSASRSDRAHQLPDPRNVVAHIQSHAFSRVTSPSPLQSQFQPSPLDTASSTTSASFVTAASNTTSMPRSKKSKSASSRSSATASQSPSLPSPVSHEFNAGEAAVVSPSTVEHGLGFFDLEDATPVRRPRAASSAQFTKGEPSAFPAARIGGGTREGFPSTGFGGAARTRDLGVFLSRRGEDESEAADGL